MIACCYRASFKVMDGAAPCAPCAVVSQVYLKVEVVGGVQILTARGGHVITPRALFKELPEGLARAGPIGLSKVLYLVVDRCATKTQASKLGLNITLILPRGKLPTVFLSPSR